MIPKELKMTKVPKRADDFITTILSKGKEMANNTEPMSPYRIPLSFSFAVKRDQVASSFLNKRNHKPIIVTMIPIAPSHVGFSPRKTKPVKITSGGIISRSGAISEASLNLKARMKRFWEIKLRAMVPNNGNQNPSLISGKPTTNKTGKSKTPVRNKVTVKSDCSSIPSFKYFFRQVSPNIRKTKMIVVISVFIYITSELLSQSKKLLFFDYT